MAEHGVHTYALIDGWERPRVRQRFAGQALAAVFERPPIFSYGDTHFYDLALPPAVNVETTKIPMRLERMEAPTPEAFPKLEWKVR
jgi:hypothetical protein